MAPFQATWKLLDGSDSTILRPDAGSVKQLHSFSTCETGRPPGPAWGSAIEDTAPRRPPAKRLMGVDGLAHPLPASQGLVQAQQIERAVVPGAKLLQVRLLGTSHTRVQLGGTWRQHEEPDPWLSTGRLGLRPELTFPVYLDRLHRIGHARLQCSQEACACPRRGTVMGLQQRPRATPHPAPCACLGTTPGEGCSSACGELGREWGRMAREG